ncbi:MAG: hypothetical protein ABIJ05_01820 [Patescibacteria group bacterium]
MKEINSEPLCLNIREIVKGSSTYRLTEEDLYTLFQRQAENDDSGDIPILISSFFGITPLYLTFNTEYTISDLDNPLKRINLKLGGTVITDENWNLSDGPNMTIHADEKTTKRVLKSFGVKKELPVKTFLKSMLEDALKPDVTIKEMSISNNLPDSYLLLEFEHSDKT